MVGQVADLLVYQAPYRRGELLVLFVAYHQGSHLRSQSAEEEDVALADFVEHGDEVALAIVGTLRSLYDGSVGDEAVVTDGVVVDVATHSLYQVVVADGDISQCGVEYSRVLQESVAHLDALFEYTELNLPIEVHIFYICGGKFFVHTYGSPVFGSTSVFLQDANLVFSK